MEKTILNAPHIAVDTADGIKYLPLQDDMLSHREVMVVGDINTESANSLISQLLYLNREHPHDEITMYINSPGGEVDSGLALYDVMQSISCPIRTVCTGLAASMASLLFAAGSTREMLPHGRLMLHDPLVMNAGGSALAVKSRVDDLMRTRDELSKIYAKHTGKKAEEILEVTAKDTYFSSEAAIEFGLADKIIEEL